MVSSHHPKFEAGISLKVQFSASSTPPPLGGLQTPIFFLSSVVCPSQVFSIHRLQIFPANYPPFQRSKFQFLNPKALTCVSPKISSSLEWPNPGVLTLERGGRLQPMLGLKSRLVYHFTPFFLCLLSSHARLYPGCFFPCLLSKQVSSGQFLLISTPPQLFPHQPLVIGGAMRRRHGMEPKPTSLFLSFTSDARDWKQSGQYLESLGGTSRIEKAGLADEFLETGGKLNCICGS